VIDLDLCFTDMIIGSESSKREESDMQRIFMDIEGGLSYTGDIIQLGWVTTDWNFNIIGAGSKYYRNMSPIEPKAFEVHQLSEEYLWSISDTHFISDYFNLSILYPTVPTMYITYTAFDLTKLKNEVAKVNDKLNFGTYSNSLVAIPNPISYWDAFTITGRRLQQSLSDFDRMRIGDTQKIIKDKFGLKGVKPHDALYDSIATYELCRGWLGVSNGSI